MTRHSGSFPASPGFHRLPDLVPRDGRIRVAHVEHVDPIGPQPAQRIFARSDDVACGQAAVIHAVVDPPTLVIRLVEEVDVLFDSLIHPANASSSAVDIPKLSEPRQRQFTLSAVCRHRERLRSAHLVPPEIVGRHDRTDHPSARSSEETSRRSRAFRHHLRRRMRWSGRGRSADVPAVHDVVAGPKWRSTDTLDRRHDRSSTSVHVEPRWGRGDRPQAGGVVLIQETLCLLGRLLEPRTGVRA
jgi:hypothetical protein